MNTFIFNKSFSFRAVVAFLGIAMLGVLAFASAPKTEAHADPAPCTSSGFGISLGAFRADGTTPVVGTVAAGETIRYVTTLSHLGGVNCNYELGTLTITKPDGVVVNVTGAGIPLITTGSPFSSAAIPVSYVVNYAHSGGDGILDATTSYTGGTSHTPVIDSPVNGGSGISVIMESHIIIQKNAIPDGSQVFTFQNNFGGSHPASFNLTDDATPGLPQYNATVLPGKYAVSETPIPAGWQLEIATCDMGEAIGDIDVAPGETVTCTFTNEQLGRIILIKNTIGGDASFDFDATGAGLPVDIDLLTVGGTASTTFENLDPDNTYTLLENTPVGWIQNSGVCDKGETIDSIDLDAGETVTCTFTNTKKGKIIVIKQTIPDGSQQSFEFDTSYSPNFFLTDGQSNDASQPPVGGLAPGNYSVAEIVPAGWVLVSAVCDDGSPPNNISLQSSETVTCTFTNQQVQNLIVEKTATTSYKRTYEWRINKSVAPSVWNMFMGDSGTSEYTVQVVKSQPIDSDFLVTGTISITNPVGNPPANITGVTDSLSVDGVSVVVCPGGNAQVLAPGAILVCSYSKATAGATDQTNTATVTTDGVVPGGADDANVDFGAPSQVVNDSITVNDSLQGPLGPFNTSDSTSYEKTFVCGSGQGQHTGTGNNVNNTATIVETGVNDSAQVTINCYTLQVTKDAIETLDRKYNWNITKIGDQTNLVLAPGQVVPVNYDVTVSMTGSVDSNWNVTGTITVHNPASVSATVNSVSDVISGFGAATVVCPGDPGPFVIAPGGDLVCTYSASLPDGTTRTNTATAVQQNYDYDKAGVPTLDGTTNYSGNANVNFGGAVINKIDECITVSDTFPELALAYVDLIVCVGEDTLPKTFEYIHNVGPYTDQACGTPEQVNNTASLVTNDTGTQDSDDHNVVVEVVCTCTLTQGYWKTHNDSFKGGAPVDPNWELIGPLKEQTLFFNSGKTWFEVFWTSPQGNAWYNLAHQYMAAKLNVLSGATTTPAVAAALASAEALFTNPLYDTPAEFAALGKKSPIRANAINWAGTLGAYNEGLIGPGHCSEPQLP